jgi:high-affinity iron transporter
MGQVLFVVWRESVEALLVIGILYAWLRANPDRGNAMRYLWGGVALGVLMALGLGGAILWFQTFFAGDAQDYFQLTMVMVAAALIIQMVFWMRRNGRHLRRNLEAGMQRSTETANWFGMLTLVALAVAREGSEMVIFLYGLGLTQQGIGLLRFGLISATGFALAGLTFWTLQWSGRRLSWKAFFLFSEVMLLMLAGSLLVTGLEKMEGFGWIPSLKAQIWNSAWLLDDSSPVGAVIATLTGYRAQPSLLLLLAYGAYWLAILGVMRKKPVLSPA